MTWVWVESSSFWVAEWVGFGILNLAKSISIFLFFHRFLRLQRGHPVPHIKNGDTPVPHIKKAGASKAGASKAGASKAEGILVGFCI